MYKPISVPEFARKDFFDFTKAEAKEYLKWFINIKEERLEILKQNVLLKIPDWQLDYSLDSLKVLYKWFKEQIGYRAITEEEKSLIVNQINKTPLLSNVISVPEFSFTVETVSICFDIGLYFGDVLISADKEIKWHLKLNSRNYIYYAQPLVSKIKSKVPLSPRAAIEGIARRLLDKDVKEITFIELYNINLKKF